MKSKKKKSEQSAFVKPIAHKEHMPTTLPEPKVPTRSLQSAPSSFKTRVKPIQSDNKATSSRARARTLSAPSSLDAAEQDSLAMVEFEEQEELKISAGVAKEQRSSSPQPLPLPSPHSTSLTTIGSFKAVNASGPQSASGPLPLPPSGTLRNFSYEEISAACHHFSSDRCTSEGLSSVMYMASFGDDASSSKKFEATVTRLHPSTQGLRDFINEVNTLASLQHPNLCKLLGFHARDSSEQRMLVYERLFHGSLDRLLALPSCTRKDHFSSFRNKFWLSRSNPFGIAMYNEFSTANIHIDKDFSAKLSGYGCVGHILETEDISGNSLAVANLSNLDSRHPREERNLVKWSQPFLADDCRLSLIMDPLLKGRFPMKASRTVADIAQRCLQKDPSERPTMRTMVENLKVIQDMKYSCRFPLQEPAAIPGKHLSRWPSLNGIVTLATAPKFGFSHHHHLDPAFCFSYKSSCFAINSSTSSLFLPYH
ncbi:B3 domain-containing transcription repressor VAL2-like isoform X1 [Hibiscus syriacus]|uniref:B3 domain-containing transcription repressor VAL2-like isoform X1 n=1 Tax=Hibiscus syriacus TaxID=106335 RepID=A0A6A3A145_HIBSY|nr:B3 domain-containing transcription repressor VAL2-like isoform X1 [Hibiscus syriacus]